MRIAVMTGLALFAAACSDTRTSIQDAGLADSGTTFAAPLLAPELYDCRVASAPLPARPSTATPLSCALDPACHTTLVIAHRSAGGTAPGLGVLAPENTMSAIRAGLLLGVDFLETDPRMTKDGVFVNVHDPDLATTTTGTGAAEDHSWAQIQQLELKPTGAVGDFSCDRVITIEALLRAAKGRTHVLLDANKIDVASVEALVDLVVSTDTFEEAIFDTSSLEKVRRARLHAPNIQVQIRPDTAADVASQVQMVGDPPPVVLEIDLPDLDDAVVEARRVAPSAKIAASALGGFDLQMSLEGHAPAELLALPGRGVSMIQTDRPDLLLRELGLRR